MQAEEYIERENLIEEDEGVRYINGDLLRRQHQQFQPTQAPRIDFVQPPKLITVERKISGPSAEIVFSVKPIQGKDLKHIEHFYTKLVDTIKHKYSYLLERSQSCLEMQSILKSVLQALFDNESRRVVTKNGRETISRQEIEDILVELMPYLDTFYESNDPFLALLRDFRDLLNKTKFFCVDSKDKLISKQLMDGVIENAVMKEISPSKILELNKEEEMKVDDSCLHLISKHLNVMDLFFQFSMQLQTIKNEEEEKENVMRMCGEVKQKIVTFRETQASLKEEVKENQIPETISFDNVSCFYCPIWPPVARNWLSRRRSWPEEAEIQAIAAKGCYFVPKQSDHDATHRLEWRLSFSSAEISIAKLRTPRMRYCYFVFKSLFYKHLKVLSEDVPCLPSYVAKTCMLNVSEDKEVDWWDRNSITTCVIELLQYLDRCLKKNSLTHHFIESLNLLADASPQTIRESREVVSQILRDPSTNIVIDGRPLEIFTAVAHEVSELNSLSGTSTKTSEESYGEVSSLYSQNMMIQAKITQCQLLGEVYQLTGKIRMAEKVINAQEQHLAITNTNNQAKAMTQRFLQVNKETMEENRQLLKDATSKAGRVLGEIASLFGLDRCMVCDICQQKIPCKQDRFSCKECDFDVCARCMTSKVNSSHNNKDSSNANQEDSEDSPTSNHEDKHDATTNNKDTNPTYISKSIDGTPLHEHPLLPTNECSLYCYTNFNYMKLGMTPDQASIVNLEEMLKISEKMPDLIAALGTKSKNLASAIGGDDSIISGLLQELYTDLGLKYKDAYGKDLNLRISINVNSANSNLSVFVCFICFLDVDSTQKDKPLMEDVEFAKLLVQDAERREMIKKLVF